MSKLIPICPTVTLTVSLSVFVNILRLLFEGAGRGLHSAKYSTVEVQIPLRYPACELVADKLASEPARELDNVMEFALNRSSRTQ